MLYSIEVLDFSRLKVLIIVGRLLILLLITLIYWYSCLLIHYSRILTILKISYFFLSCLLNLQEFLSYSLLILYWLLMLWIIFPDPYLSSTFISGFRQQISFIFSHSKLPIFLLLFCFTISFKKFTTCGGKYFAYFWSRNLIDFSLILTFLFHFYIFAF